MLSYDARVKGFFISPYFLERIALHFCHLHFAAKTKMNILIYRWNSYNQSDIEKALKNSGCTCSCFTETISNYENDDLFCEKLAAELKNNDYDFCFSINYFPLIANVCHAADTLYVCWNCDAPLLAMYHNSVFFDTNIIFEFDYSHFSEFKNMGIKNIFYLPLAANVQIYKDILPSETSLKYDISFVGSLYEKNSYDNIRNRLPDYLYGYLDGAIYAQTQISGGNILEKLLTPEICSMLEEITEYNKSDDSFVTTNKLFSTTVLGFKAASVTRKNYLNLLSSHFIHRVHLFTNSDTSDIPLVNSHGSVDYVNEMPFIFNESKINLNMTIPNITSGISLRVWDILSCRGFLMTDFRQELLIFFKPDKDIVIYESADELIDKSAFYLKNDELRTKIIKNAYAKISSCHTIDIRIKKILDTVKNFI